MKLLAPVLLFVSGSVFAADLTVVEEIIAKCNGDIITRGDLDRSRKELANAARQQGANGPTVQQAMAEHEKNFLRDRIDQLLLVQKAKDLNISVDSEISKRVAQIQRDSGIAEPEKFQDYVKEGTGMSFEDFKLEMKNDMLRQRVIRQEVGDKVNVKHEEIEKYYNERKTEFVPEMARDNSDAITNKTYGQLDPFKKGVLAKVVEDQVWNQPKGYVTDPISTPSGYLILRVDEHQKAGQPELAEVENEIMEKLYAPRMEPKVREYLTELRTHAFLEIKSDWVDSGAAPGVDTSWKDPAQLKPETITKGEVANKTHRKKLLWAVPIPGTKAKSTSTSQ